MPLSAPDKSARVGVILPTRNRAGSLRAALDSVLDQTWRDLEVLVVDDASTDATAECLAGVTDPRVRVLRLDHPHGAGGARNAGLKAMDNDWIAFQDSDDRWLPEKLEKQLAAVEAAGNKAGFAYCRCRRSGAGVSYLFPPIHARTVAGELFEALLGGNLVSTQTALVRRACIDAHGRFDEGRFVANARDPQVKMIEVKLSQGAKPGHGGVLPAAKVRRRSNIGSCGAATNSTLAPSAVVQVWISRARRAGAWPSRAARDSSAGAAVAPGAVGSPVEELCMATIRPRKISSPIR